MNGRVLNEEEIDGFEKSINDSYGCSMCTLMSVGNNVAMGSPEVVITMQKQQAQNLIATIRDKDKTLSDVAEYFGMVLSVAKELDDAITDLIKVRKGRQLSPDEWSAFISAASASERYTRIVDGENVGCLEGDETHEEREASIQRLNRLRDALAKMPFG